MPFGLGEGNSIDIPFHVKVGFIQRDKFNKQRENNHAVYRLNVVNAQCITGSEKYPDAGINFSFAIDKYSQAYGNMLPVLDI